MDNFGVGFTYCIGLFLAHAEREITNKDYSRWFNGAADHLYDLEIPENISAELKDKVKEFTGTCLRLRLQPATKVQHAWAIETAKNILLKYDLECGIEAEKATWE